MPRQPLEDTPGLPPYGKRSSERRKEQNRMAQRLLRERRQQQEAAQALKLLQQQNEIRRLERLITDLRSENLTLRSQSQTRRRQSVIPISSRSKSLAMLHTPTTTSGAGTTLEPNYKPFLGRHSIDYSSLHGAGIDTADSSHRLHERRICKSWSSDDPRGLSPASHLRQPGARSNASHSAPLAPDHQPSGRAARLSTCTSQDTKTQAHSNNEEASPTNSFCAKTQFSRMSDVAQPLALDWLSRNSTPPIREAAGESRTNTWANSAQMVEQSSQINSASNTGIVLPSVNLASFWPAQPLTSPSKLGRYGDVDHVSALRSNLSVVPSEFFPNFTPLMSSYHPQFQKTTNGSSDANSLATNSHNHSSFSTSSFASFQFPFISPELGSHDVALSASPTAIESSLEAQLEDRNLSEINAPICFGSPFSESNDSEINVQSNFDVTMTWIEPNGYNVETLSPSQTHTESLGVDANEIWGSDF
ncbi:hypothetical protein MJO28_002240 [Puccinia striiformis f. sp. tritici]|uniref:Uncharacterized protein n=1 Tax=Puccinia striiformis f. sp. tritici TaxID=168172 RepID=A0ACC0EW73_9BASI|nr:hypothetical protein MJO28_002240 [Puccinia striiformis f. sp. tritici]